MHGFRLNRDWLSSSPVAAQARHLRASLLSRYYVATATTRYEHLSTNLPTIGGWEIHSLSADFGTSALASPG